VTSPLSRLTREERRALQEALRAGRIAPPYSEMSLRPLLGAQTAGSMAVELSRLHGLGMTPALFAEMLQLAGSGNVGSRASLVWTGPEGDSTGTRDTGVVVRSLFERATSRVLIAGFAVHQGASVFRVLAERMDVVAELEVEMYLNVERGYGDTTDSAEILRIFADEFRDKHWGGERMPRVYYDPRALELSEKGKKRAVLHAKCVVADDRHVLVSSANFTEAAQDRNIEVGVLLDDAAFAESLRGQFAWLVRTGQLKSVPGI
jgi:hypothetical protein